MTVSDKLFYERLKRKQAKTRARMARKSSLMDERKRLIQSVRDGDITLDEAKALNPTGK